MVGTASARLVAEKPLVVQVSSPFVADATFTGLALSTLHALEHCSVGLVPEPPLNLAPALFSVSELAASWCPPAT